MADVLVFPASFSQRQTWFQDQLDPGGALYNVPFAVRLEGALDAPALRAALTTIVDRHEVLRTTFGVEDGTPVQVIAPRPSLELPFIDLSLRADPEREADALAADEATRSFDLARGPLLRTTLLRLGEARHQLLLTAHHGVFDGWSAGVFFHELAAAYAARVAPASARPLPELPLQYADYAVWQREWLEGTAAATQLAYWRERLRGAPEVLDLPADRPRPTSQSYRGATHVFDLPPSLVGALRELSRGEGATLFMTLLAAFKALLGRLAGQDEVVVGTPVANRGRVEIEGLIGCFVNTLVLRTDLAGDPPFRELLARVRQTALAAYAHQELPFEKVVEKLQPERSLAFSPLFQVMFTLQQDITLATELPGLALSLVEVPSGTAKLDLTVFLKERGQGLQGVVEYATDLFDAPSVARRMAQYRTLLEAVAARPDTRLSRLPLLTQTERQQVLVDWNRTETALPAHAWVHEQVEAQARRTPEAVAVAAGRESLGYDELERRADAVARCLQESGVGPESLVGLFLERSPDMLVALLGVLKSGGAYLPLDPSFPEGRLAHMLSDSGARTVLVSRALRDAVPPSKATVMVIEEATENGEGRPRPVALQTESLAYVLYTSGSTGRPKGVAVSHGALLNFLESARREPGIGPEDRLCAVTTLSFDIAALELFLPLLVGGRVVLADRETAMDGRALATLLEASGSTMLQATPATWRLLLDAGWPGSPRLTALCGGEALPRELAEALVPRVAALWNMYGPTETTVWSTCQRVESGSGPISIGRPFANTEAYVLDAYLEPVPMGVRGELYLGGAGVARGYLGQPELTAERFVPDPFGVRPGARLYWTGDLARRRGDGALEVLGRLDHQVKIRGFRIELEEVETALLRHPAVARAVVATHDEGAVERALVAWIVPERGSEASPRELREFLRGVLPEYMVPSLFVTLEALPLTPNGKIDRRALPAPGADAGIDTVSGQGYVAPRTPVEEALAAVWCSVLGREAVGIHDNFFELGGHSLLAARVIARTREGLGVELSLRSLFQAPTVAGLAAALAVASGREVVSRAPTIPRIPRGGDLPLSRGQERLWFVQRMAPDRPVYNVPLALRLRGPVNVPALDRAVAAIGTRHEVLRMAFPSRDGRPVAVVRAALNLEHDDLSSLAEPQREDAAVCLVHDEARRPFDLEHGPLCRVRLARLTAEDHLLVLNLHHIVCDLWSLGLLLRELSAAYATGVEGRTSAWPEPMVQYADYAAWQRGLDESGPDAALDEWVRRLEGMPVLELPADRPRPAVQTFAGATVSRQLPQRLAAPIEALAASEGATLFITLLAAFVALLHRHTSQDDMAVGSPVTDREQPGLDGLVGFFVNTLVLRTDLGGDPSFRELIARVRETVLEAHAHRHVPFERLVERLSPRRVLDRNPLFQAAFLFDNEALGPFVLEGVGVEQVEAGTGTAKFDLMLAVGRGNEGLTASLEYATDLFDADRMARFLGHFEVLLQTAVADPDRPLSTLPPLTASERHRVLVEWNATDADYPRDACVHELFEEQARLAPEAVALASDQGEMSYGELNRRADDLARRLANLGVGLETPVGLCLERSAQAIVALLAILKTGAAYLPLDAAHPRERLALMLRDAGSSLVVTEARFRGLLPAEVRAVCVDEAAPATVGPCTPLARRVFADGLAYVMYTSGSTGTPKGIAVPHRGVVRLVKGTGYARFGPEQVMALLAPLTFDASTLEIWGALLSGGRVAIFPPQPPSLAEVGAFVERHRVTTLWLTAGLFHQMAEEHPEGLRPLQQLLAGGDVLQPAHVRRVLAAVPGLRLINGYGPTENTTFSCCHPMSQATAPGLSVPIGRPIAHTRAYVLDGRLHPVPIGVPGELCVGGDGLARGYVRSPDATAARFVPDPFAALPGGRLYRTGDRARWTPDGTLEFLGRLDRQAKLRGFRVEPGEVEAVLAALPRVQAAAVLVREDVPGDKRLVAYVVGDLDTEAAPAELQASLRARLPEYMVPWRVVILERLPLNANGKVDGAALPAPVVSPPAGQPPRRPDGAMERLVARVWREVLKLEAVGTRDNFFDLGGNSLLLIQAQSRLAKSLGREVSLVEMFRHATVEALAAHLGGGVNETEGLRGSRDRAASRRDALDRRQRRELTRR